MTLRDFVKALFFLIRLPGGMGWPEGSNRAEATASSTSHLLSLSRDCSLLLWIIMLVNLEYVVRINDIT
jgi:hypothetical protein